MGSILKKNYKYVDELKSVLCAEEERVYLLFMKTAEILRKFHEDLCLSIHDETQSDF